MNSRRALALTATSALLLAGCGGGDDEDEAQATTGITSGTPGARIFGGSFANVKDAPEGVGEVAGTAEMILAEGKTRVSVLATGLDNRGVYIGHVHNDVCSAADPGGAHFKFDPNGGDQPPNEIHLPIQFELTRQGEKKSGITSDVTVDREAGAEAKSVVIHLKRARGAGTDEATPPKISCADLKQGGGL
ncbi:MAG: hypothetical protein ACT4QF_14690 [Sporichthyaceae bacterium]